MMSKFFRRIFGTAVIGIMSLSLSSAFTMTAFAASPGDVGTWADTTVLPQSLDYTNSVTYNGYVFVIGGSSGTDKNTVYSAPLNSDGTVGTWATTTPLPQILANSTSVVYGGYVYVMGGTSGGSLWLDTVYSAPLNLNGTVGDWATSVDTLPQSINSATSIAYDGYIYVMGGYNGDRLNTVYSAPANNGTVGAWATSANALPQVLQSSSAITYNGYAYITGGISNSGASDIVYSALLGSNGTVGAWATSANTLPQGLFGHNAISYNDYVYVIGGNGSSSGYSDAVYSAPLGASGTIGTWTTSPNTLPKASQLASAITYNGYAYNIGGNGTSGNINNVYYAQLTGYLPPSSSSHGSAVTFQNLPGSDQPINVTEGQTITEPNFILEVKPYSKDGIEKVEFYIDDNLICTATTPDANSVYSCSWDTTKYHSEIKVIAYDTKGHTATLTREATVASMPEPTLTTLPQTGADL